jgi:hypothetical protein
MQAQRGRAIAAGMIRSLPFVALMTASASVAMAQGPIDTVERGPYVCERPGDAASQAGIPQAERSFTIETDSRYGSPHGTGTYLRRGRQLTMTSGSHKGEAYVVVRPGFLRLLDADGKPSRLRCVLKG